MLALLVLIASLLLVLASSSLFTHSVEAIAHKHGLGAGVAGSLLAAISTAMPETIVPLLALVQGHAQSIGTGAIMGAPLMLSTLTLGLLAITAWPQRGWKGVLKADAQIQGDLKIFLLAYTYALLLMVIPHAWMPGWVGAMPLLIAFAWHTWHVVYHDKHSETLEPAAFLHGYAVGGWIVLVLALVVMVTAAEGLVWSLQQLADKYRWPPLLMALFLVPVATELPEKINSIFWVRRGKDKLALGNISGALAFQGCILPAIGLWGGGWSRQPLTLWAAAVTLLAVLWLVSHRVWSLRVLLPLNGVYLAYWVVAWRIS